MAAFMLHMGLYQTASGYLLEGEHLIELVCEKLGSIQALLIDQTVRVYPKKDSGNATEMKETVRFQPPDAVRSDLSGKSINQSHIAFQGERITVVNGKPASYLEGIFQRYTDVLLFRKPSMLGKKLQRLQIDIAITSLGRFENSSVYIIGSDYPDLSRNQVWFDKASFNPIRLILVQNQTGQSNDLMDIRYLNWKNYQGVLYPAKILFYQDQQLIREILVLSAQTHPRFSGDIYSVARIKHKHGIRDRNIDDLYRKKDIEEVKQIIGDFHKLYSD